MHIKNSSIANGKDINYLCPICDQAFTDCSEWRTHAKNHFTSERIKFKCNICSTLFSDHNLLRNHSSIHYSDKSVQTENSTDEVEYTVKSIARDSSDEERDNNVSLVSSIKTEDYQENCVQAENSTSDQLLDNSCTSNLNEIKHKNININIPTFKPKPISKNKELTCAICGQIVNDLIRTKSEMIQELNTDQICTCPICFRYFRTISKVEIHINKHFAGGNHSTWIACRDCTNQNNNFFLRIDKRITCTDIKCSMCPKTFQNKYKLRHHQRDHMDRCVYFCAVCPKRIIGQARYSKHLYTHGRQKIRPKIGCFECSYCGKIFHNKSTLTFHIRAHVFTDRFECHLCLVVLKTKSNLKQHLKLHLGKKEASCDVCGKMFYQKSILSRHMLSHTQEKPYQCKQCHKTFRYNTGLSVHMRIHTGERPYKCSICDKQYIYSTDLRRHKRIHGGVQKNITCDLCDKKFYENRYLKIHKISAHHLAVI